MKTKPIDSSAAMLTQEGPTQALAQEEKTIGDAVADDAILLYVSSNGFSS